MSGNVRFDFMHFMPYIHLPHNHKEYKSLWVNFPNKFYDPKKGIRFTSDIFRAGDRQSGQIDAIVVNEHHNTSYSMMAAPNLIAPRNPQIKNAKICVWGTPPNLEFPNRLAEEYAMLDVISKGRPEVTSPSAPAWNIGRTRSIPSPRATGTANRSTLFSSLDAGRSDHLLR